MRVSLVGFIAVSMLIIGVHAYAQGLASLYPGDINIHNHPDVIFAEMFEEKSLQELFALWSSNSGSNTAALDSSTFPLGSSGRQSLRLFTTAGPLGVPGTYRTAMLYKVFPQGLPDSVFFRWYVKYNTNRTFHHSGPRMGGAFPASITPYAPAGKRPDGSDYFYAGVEPTKEKVAFATVDYYTYWMHQRSSIISDTLYYGNSFVNNSAVGIDLDSWNCIELMMKINTPVSNFNGEMALWINGVKVSHMRQGFPDGIWDDDNFIPGSGLPFEGFQWRNSDSLRLNYVWLLHFVDQDPAGQKNDIYFDHVVVAKSYIGPLSGATGVMEQSRIPASYELKQNYPNPFNPSTTIGFTVPVTAHATLKIFNMLGQEAATLYNNEAEADKYHQVQFNASGFATGLYIARLEHGGNIQTMKMMLVK